GIDDAARAKSWLRNAKPTNAVAAEPKPERVMQVAMTSDGLRALGVPAGVLSEFAPEFVAGLTSEGARSRRLGDVGANAPSHWSWGGPGRVPHVVLLLYAPAGRVAAWADELTPELARNGLRMVARLTAADFQGREPFGFKDGIS